jgi:hypothetical protein
MNGTGKGRIYAGSIRGGFCLAASKKLKRMVIIVVGGKCCGEQNWVTTGTDIPVRSPDLTDREGA